MGRKKGQFKVWSVNSLYGDLVELISYNIIQWFSRYSSSSMNIPGKLLEMPIFRPYSRPAKSETLKVEPRKRCVESSTNVVSLGALGQAGRAGLKPGSQTLSYLKLSAISSPVFSVHVVLASSPSLFSQHQCLPSLNSFTGNLCNLNSSAASFYWIIILPFFLDNIPHLSVKPLEKHPLS